MTKLEQLIQELCPDGVEFKSIKSICRILRGKRLTRNQLVENANYPVFHGGLVPLGYYTDYNREPQTVMVINVGASAGTVGYCENKFWSSDGCFCIEHSPVIESKFLYYILLCKEKTIQSRVRVAGIPTLDAKILETLEIPVPPLPVQEEIVRILDNFTELTTELTAELTARKQQYEYYRTKLLDFNMGIHWKPLQSIATVTDYVANGSFAALKENVNYKHSPDYAVLIRTTDFSTNFDEKSMIYIDKHAYEFLEKSKLFGGEIIINNIGAGVGSTFRCPYLDIHMSLAPNAVTVKTENDAFYYHWFKSKWGQDTLKKIVGKSAMPKFNKTGLRSILVPVPPLAEQERIVAILDRFDTLCNDLTSGLPAEIEARQKQYEYYRDKLLTFREKP